MKEISTVGIDIAKSVFQVHAIDVHGNVVVRRQLRRQQMLKFFAQVPPCLIGIEACGTAHYWARQLSAFGHDVRLMPPTYVKPYVKRQKNDAADAEAICEAVMRGRRCDLCHSNPLSSSPQRCCTVQELCSLSSARCSCTRSAPSLPNLAISIGVGISQMARVVRELAASRKLVVDGSRAMAKRKLLKDQDRRKLFDYTSQRGQPHPTLFAVTVGSPGDRTAEA